MLRKLSQVLGAALLCALPANAVGGNCSSLAITTADNGDGTTHVAFDVTGSAANSIHLILIGDTVGDVTFDLAGTTLTLGLLPPFFGVPLGLSDAAGDLSVGFDIPAGLGDWNGQSIGVEFSTAGFGFCTSNVASFSI